MPPQAVLYDSGMSHLPLSGAEFTGVGADTRLAQLNKIYDDPNLRPTIPEQVIVHMVLATIFFQLGIRNKEDKNKQSRLNDLSNRHYHWCLHRFYEIAADTSVAAIQALVMLGQHTRSFPKPGASSLIAYFALEKAIELNLHRAKPLPGGGTNLQSELRKRAWWSVLSLQVTLSGRLGRPMAITVEEFDTDYPLPLNDECLTEDGVDESKMGPCMFMVGLVGFKITPLYMQMYNKLYAARRDPQRYVDTVVSLQQQYEAWKAELPEELQPDKCRPEARVFALYVQAFSLEYVLCLRHPSVCMTNDPQFCAENKRICSATATELLKNVQELLRLKSLDTTWYQVAVYCAAMFTTLESHWERRLEITQDEVTAMKLEVGSWMAILREIGRLVGKPSILTTLFMGSV